MNLSQYIPNCLRIVPAKKSTSKNTIEHIWDYDDAFVRIAQAASSFRTENEFRKVMGAVIEFRKKYTSVKPADVLEYDIRRLLDLADEQSAELLDDDVTAFTHY